MKQVKLYDNTITINFNENARNRYIIEETGGSPVGVTTVLGVINKPALMTWPMNEALNYLKTKFNSGNPIYANDFLEAAKAYLKKSDQGKNTGTDIHAALEAFLTGNDYEKTPNTAKAIIAFEEWENKVHPKVLATEQIIYSKNYDFAGTYDALFEVDGKVVLVDFKTTNSSRFAPLGIYPEMFLQLGAYSAAHQEENPLEIIEDLMIIRVGKDGVLNTLRSSELGLSVQYCQDAFLSTLQTYKFLTPLTKQLKEKK